MHSFQKAFTLIEIIITIVILSIATGAIIGAFSTITRSSADPILIQQSVAIAQAYMEEINLQAYEDPVDESTDAEGSNRTLYNDVDDYNGLADTVVRDSNGNAISALSNFTVSVIVSADTLNGETVQNISVTVTSPGDIPDFNLIGYKADF